MKKDQLFRYSILGLFLVLFSFFSINHFVLGGGEAASVDALCPFGGLESLYTYFKTGNFVPRIMISSMILFVGILLTVLIFRRGFCGWICPFGTVQELLNKITKKKYELPSQIDKFARYIKYLVLAVILIGTAITGTLVFRGYDPFMTFFHFGKGLLWDFSADEVAEHAAAYVVTVFVLLGSVFINRFWCRYLCPLGAVTAIFAKFGLTSIKRDNKKCIDCGVCDKICPVKVKISNVDKIKSVECIDCTSCVSSCSKSALSIKLFNEKVSIKKYAIGLIFILLTIIGTTKAAGLWQSVPTASLVNITTGSVDADNIKGWMTLEEISKETGIHLIHFFVDFKLQEEDAVIPIKDIGDKYGIELHAEDLREYVKNFKHGSDHVEEVGVICPWGLHDDPSPGQCGLYEDKDGNSICDLSE